MTGDQPRAEPTPTHRSGAATWWLVAACCLVVVVATVAAGLSLHGSVQRPRVAVQHVNLVYTNWVPDGTVTNGPQPGYKPELTGLAGADIMGATANIDATGESWVVYVTFNAGGAALFADLTRAAVAACPGDPTAVETASCPQRFLAIWLDLTQRDIDSWENPAYVLKVSAPYDMACLTGKSSVPCAKLVTNPVVLQEIDGGEIALGGNFNQSTADALASALSPG